ncbi:hypothetical protein PLESTB_001861700 [Pleodorina starrii]|uniref:Uncharacterized protein n=1 Tax=Pleodorina starrii TaxID=330485 RepID=A0A9W6C1H7_9CHLO|nr:hypothetical protein PLESTM_000925800 [Pleodorina starrii]GLC62244.1 hypothetical protein PLESTB_001861700 [Pleodorina starrii]GLC70391.1 hypothetical protein PLESTF_000968000 [Pleodorina starrii]
MARLLRLCRAVVSLVEAAASPYPLALIQGPKELPLWPALHTHTYRGFAARAPTDGLQPRGLLGSLADVDVETSELLHPQSRAQRIFAARVERALVQAIHRDMFLRSALVESYGISIHAVRLTHDRLHATVLWDCHRHPLSLADACSVALKRYTQSIRKCLARSLGAPDVPQLKWRHAALDGPDQQALSVIQQLEWEEQQGRGRGQAPGSSSSSGPDDPRVGEQPVSRREQHRVGGAAGGRVGDDDDGGDGGDDGRDVGFSGQGLQTGLVAGRAAAAAVAAPGWSDSGLRPGQGVARGPGGRAHEGSEWAAGAREERGPRPRQWGAKEGWGRGRGRGSSSGR